MKKQTFINYYNNKSYNAQETLYWSQENELFILLEAIQDLNVLHWINKQGGIVAKLNGHPRLLGYIKQAQYGHQYLQDLKFRRNKKGKVQVFNYLR